MRANLAIVVAATLTCTALAHAATKPLPTGAFEITQTLTLPGTPEAIYDAITGDISPWWDHHMSEHPARLFIDARPGGGFWEYFDADGHNGVRHAVVILAERGKILRFQGPLGLSGNALDLVCTYAFAPAGSDSTTLTLTVRGAGQVEEGWPETIDRVWHHFLFERFKPYVESGAYRKR